jgi:TonB-dependent starch-binding outer membrane protein SusC
MKPGGFPANYDRTGIATASGQPTTNCDLLQVASGACTPTGLDVWNPLEQASPFRTQRATSGSVSLSGGVGSTLARVSATGQRTLGVTGDDDDGKLGLRANLVQHVNDAIDIGVHGGQTRTSAGLPIRGNSIGSLISNGLFGSATDDASGGYRESLFRGGVRQRATHSLLGASASWRLKSWLAATAAYGQDRVAQDEEDHTTSTLFSPGVDRSARLTHRTTTTTANLTASYPVELHEQSINAQTVLGYERVGSKLEVSSLAQSSSGSSQEALSQRAAAISGIWLRQQVTWRELIVGAALRWERPKAYGAEAPTAWFKSADASWSLGDAGWIEALRLRAAYGEGGNWAAGGASAQTAGFLDDASLLDPVERTVESEIGVEGKLGERATVGLTVFRSDATKLYLDAALPPGLGFPSTAVLPAGSMRNDGLEISARSRVFERGAVRWDANLSVATLRNRVRSLGASPPQASSQGRTQAGYPVSGYWSVPYTYADANQDGIIGANEVQFGDSAVFVGPALPTREAAMHSVWSFGRSLTASALFDYRGGHRLSNTNEELRCLNTNCRGAQDPSASLAEQAAAVAIRSGRFADSYLQDASFLKVREVSLTWNVPASWSNGLVGSNMALTLAGHNLATWTRYKGLDPELNYRRANELPPSDLGKAPLIREFVIRLDIGGGTRH